MSVRIESVYHGQLAVQSIHPPSQTRVTTEASPHDGGSGQAFAPTDLVAAALGSCVLTVLGMVAERHHLDLTGASVGVSSAMTTGRVRRIRSLSTVVKIPPERVKDPAMRKRLEAAASKCPVHQSLHPEIDAPIEFVYQ